ncbi:SLATT domain-containing protein [Kosakonia sacchari]|uniref:SLATT domain-containing protein n=1 Tax=Kosakonia sacchari TaxID=1158459 RepID=UPI001482C676|nr:SLATT domain-containing protein [Kosakonia sacchari]
MSDFSNQIWWTKKARIKAEKRLLRMDAISQSLLLWYSFFLVAYSIITLVVKVASLTETAIMVALSVLVLLLTLYVNNMRFKERAMLMKQCYEQLGLIYGAIGSSSDIDSLKKEFHSILSISENHKEIDYYRAVDGEYESASDKSKLSKHPTEEQKNSIRMSNNGWCVSVLVLIFLPFIIVAVIRHYSQV